MRRRTQCGVAAWSLLGWGGPALAAVPDGGAVWQGLASLVFVVALILALGWLLRGRFGRLGVPAARSLTVRAQLVLGPRERVLVLRVGDEEVLVGASPAGLRTLHVLARPLPADPEPPSGAGSFAQRLRSALRGEGGGS